MLMVAMVAATAYGIYSFVGRRDTVIVPLQESGRLGGIGGITLSPDGRWLTYLGGPRGNRHLAIRPSAGGEARVIERNITGSYPRLAWTPDGRYVISGVNWDDLYRVSIDGGSRESLGIPDGFGTIRQRSVNVDGKRLAFGVARTHRELWVWEDLLPKRRPWQLSTTACVGDDYASIAVDYRASDAPVLHERLRTRSGAIRDVWIVHRRPQILADS